MDQGTHCNFSRFRSQSFMHIQGFNDHLGMNCLPLIVNKITYWLWQYLQAWVFILHVPSQDTWISRRLPDLHALPCSGSTVTTWIWSLGKRNSKLNCHTFLLRFSCFSRINFSQFVLCLWTISRVMKYLFFIDQLYPWFVLKPSLCHSESQVVYICSYAFRKTKVIIYYQMTIAI